ncbi:peptidoglycan recognition family protein [Schaalia sp. ZJ1691]|uniref:peptidoglycan recognition protein family protein n=1 Tax=Schaalia sp. ZJ1691 TaxID=2709404 RepID=UPI0013EAFA8D|nr:peptidoglycan recognition family protein [Schaalia sp. ZJ1691]
MVNRAVTDTAWSPNVRYGRPGRILYIVLHHWGIDGQLHQNVVNLLCSRAYQLSAHYVASAGRVTQLVPDLVMAQHAGPTGNSYGIGIECRPEMSSGDFETVARLIAEIRREHGHLPIIGHRDVMPTACPGRWYSQLARLSARADDYQYGRATYQKPAAALPAPRKKGHDMLMIHMPRTDGGKDFQYAVFGTNFFLRFTGAAAANQFARQIGGSSLLVNPAFWEHCAKASLTGTNIPANELAKMGIKLEDIRR